MQSSTESDTTTDESEFVDYLPFSMQYVRFIHQLNENYRQMLVGFCQLFE
jgi:hypothetical protein